jgi:hypothetical protein
MASNDENKRAYQSTWRILQTTTPSASNTALGPCAALVQYDTRKTSRGGWARESRLEPRIQVNSEQA